MHSRVAAVKAPCTHNRRRVTGSSGRRREGRESEPQRRNMSWHVFNSAVLLLVVVMICCGSGGTAKITEEPSSGPNFQWKDIKSEGEGVNVESLRVPGLLKVGSDVFAVAEAQCKESPDTVFIGIASQIITKTKDKAKEEVLKNAKEKTQVLEEGTSGKEKKKVDVSRPTAVVDESDIYMLVGKHSHDDAGTCQAGTEKIKSGILLVKGEVGGEADNKKIDWKTTDGVPCTLGAKHESLTQLFGGGGSGVKMNDGTLAFPVEGTKKKEDKDVKTALLIMCSSKDVTNWTLSKGMSADGCSDPSVVEWKDDKLIMMTACDDGRRRVYESGDKGESWTEALGTLSRVWGNKQKGGKVEIVGSGFITAKIGDGEGNNKKNVMLVTLPMYSKEEGNSKGVLHLWLTDNTHITDIGPVSGDDDEVAASSLLYKSAEGETNEEELIALYEKKKGGEDEKSRSLWSVRLTEQLQRVKNVLATWKKVDERVSKLCPSESALEDTKTGTACSPTVTVTEGLVGFLSGTSTDDTWKDEYLGVNATVNKKEGKVSSTENGVNFQGAWAEWPVGKQGDNQRYHFANYNFTLVATVSIHGVPKGVTPIPLMGVRMNGEPKKSFGLSYEKEKKWILLCGDATANSGEQSRVSEPEKAQHVVILLRNGNQGSAYVDGERVGDEQCKLETTDPKGISHFYIGGDGDSAGSREGVSVTVTNVLLYNRPLDEEEVGALNKNKAPTSPVVPGIAQGTLSQSSPDVHPPSGPKLLNGNEGVGGGSASTSAPSTVTTSTGKEQSATQLPSGIFSGGKKDVDGGSSSDDDPTVVTVGGDTVRGDGPPQTPEVSLSSGEDGETAEGTDAQEGIHPLNREVNATALNSSLVNVSQGNNSDGGTMRGSGLLPSLLLLLLGLWVFAAL
ncbi:trans-sialidase [Trypanosoma cruzi cruzi]|uniref:Putative trans-sialidase, Group V n=1 Tax=Trypanosoma cruzi TaxID=5693 RepID=A0A2V2US98_TRYCR|nr:trans-sialidase [Trypanosoma cruzi cruzi]PWU86934.1 putative trans-sialidase, Group V [Trypanosoma cruzi]